MRKIHFLPILFLTMLLLLPASVSAQTSAANKRWNSFWTQFTAAVNKKSKPAVKKLMSSENDFFSGGGMEDRNDWLAMIEQYKLWGALQKSVKSGTRPSRGDTRISRTTKDNALVFAFIGGQWRFVGPMGD